MMRSDLRAQKPKEETARLNYDAVKAQRLPSVSAFGDYEGYREPRPLRSVGSKISVFPIFRTRRTAFLPSIRIRCL